MRLEWKVRLDSFSVSAGEMCLFANLKTSGMSIHEGLNCLFPERLSPDCLPPPCGQIGCRAAGHEPLTIGRSIYIVCHRNGDGLLDSKQATMMNRYTSLTLVNLQNKDGQNYTCICLKQGQSTIARERSNVLVCFELVLCTLISSLSIFFVLIFILS